jgi:hypothetical protein
MSASPLRLPVLPEEVALLRFALVHALGSISEAHPEDHAMLKALIERLESEERRSRGARRPGRKPGSSAR